MSRLDHPRSLLNVHVRGDLGDIAASGAGSAAGQLIFANLTGSITGLDTIDAITATGWLGDDSSDIVSAQSGISEIQAYGVRGTVLFYFVDPEFGLVHVRLQTWFPYTIQAYVNGHE